MPRFTLIGTSDMMSTPPAMTTSFIPEAIWAIPTMYDVVSQQITWENVVNTKIMAGGNKYEVIFETTTSKLYTVDRLYLGGPYS